MTFEVMLHFMKNFRLYNVDNLEKFLKDQTLCKKYIAEDDDLKF